MLLHVLRHVEADQRFDRFKQLVCQHLHQLRLAYAGRADEDERHGPLLRADADAVAPNGCGHGGDGLVLSDDVLLQAGIELQQLLIFLCADLAGRDLRPQFDDARQVLHRQHGLRLFLEQRDLLPQLQIAAAQLCHAGIVALGRLCVFGQHLQLEIEVIALLAQRLELADVLVFEVHVGARLVQQVDGLIRQETVGDIALRQNDGLPRDLRRDLHTVIRLIIVRDAAHDGDGLLDRRLVDRHGLEPALERGVLFDVLAVFVERRRTDDLDLAARERGLQDVRRVHRALGVARADEVVYLIDDEDDVAKLLDLFDEALHTALKLAAELRPGDERRQIHQIDLFALQLVGDILVDDALREPLGDGRLADARLADQAGVVLLAAV